MGNKKGFTLTELLVAIVILGIVTGMSFPIIRRIREANEKRQYEMYSNSITHSSKLYVDSYDEDLFGHNKSGCTYITYEMLKDRDLIEDIDMKDLSCNSKNTFIRVVKMDGKYAYFPYLGCGDENNNKEIKKVSVIYPESNKPHEMVTENCRGSDGSSLTIIAKPSEQKKYVKSVGPKIVITSPTGVKTNADIDYGWSTINSYTGVSTFSKLSLSIPSNSSQETKIMTSSNPIRITSSKINSPNATGSYYLILKINKLVDLYDTGYVGDKVEYKVFGPYNLDNTPPTISTYNVASTTTYNNKKVNLTIDGSDNITTKANLMMCISTTSSCTSYEKFSATKEFDAGGSYDGGERTIYLYLKDEAGNINNTSKKYKVYKYCDEINLVDGTTCSVTCGKGTYNRVAYDKYHSSQRCSTHDKTSGGAACNAGDCPKPTCSIAVTGTAGFNGWYISNVTLTMTTTNATSYGLSTSKTATYNSTTTATQGETSGATWYGYVSGSGGTNTCNVTVKVDRTPPSFTIRLTSNGKVIKSGQISKYDITRTFNKGDSTSGIDAVYYLATSSYSNASTRSNKSNWTKAKKQDSYTYTSDKNSDNYYRLYDNAGNYTDVHAHIILDKDKECNIVELPHNDDVVNLRTEPDWGTTSGNNWCGQGADDSTATHNYGSCSSAGYYLTSGQTAHSGLTASTANKWKVQVICDADDSSLYTVHNHNKIKISNGTKVICYRSEANAGVKEVHGSTTSYAKFVKVKIQLYDSSSKKWNPNVLKSNLDRISSINGLNYHDDVEVIHDDPNSGDISAIFYLASSFFNKISCS